MAHKHSIYDSDPHFSISPITRAIKNESSKKTTVMQNDHNSERFTFEMPRFIEGHDMTLCDKVEVHYINVSSNKTDKSEDVYRVNDVQISPEDENIVIFSWLISGNATKYAGNLSFLVSFKCFKGEVIDYAWHTDIHKQIAVGEGMNLTDAAAFEYSDILASWEIKILKKVASLEKFTEGLKYLCYEDGCVVSGIGTATDKDIIIPSKYNGIPVTEISTTAFDGNTNITSITIPDSVTKINSYAFKGCTNLKRVVIPASVTSIGYQAFEGCANLTIYCEAESHPSGWSVNWNRYNQSNTQANCPVIWGYAADFPTVNNKLNNKLNKINEAWILYGNGANAAPTKYYVSEHTYPQNVVRRNEKSDIMVIDEPISDNGATSKKYVKGLVNPLEERVSELENLTLDHPKITSTGYEIPVPSEVGSSALVKSIGGATEKVLLTKNIIDPRKIECGEPETTITHNEDGSIFLNVSSSLGYGTAIINLATLGFPTGKYYTEIVGDVHCDYLVTGEIIIRADADFEFDEDSGESSYLDTSIRVHIMVWQDTSQSYDDYEMEIPSGNIVFEPYKVGFQHAEVERIESIGANLIPFPYNYKGNIKGVGHTETTNGVTFEVLENGLISARGTATAAATFHIFFAIMPAGVYHLSGKYSSGGQVIVSYNANVVDNDYTHNGHGVVGQKFTHVGGAFGAYVKIDSGVTVNNIFKPIVTKNVFISEFKPYRAEPIDSITIPEAVRNLDGFGLGIDSTDYNYIECIDDKKLYWQKCKELVLTGTEQYIGQYDYNGMKGVRFDYILDDTYNRAKAICTDTNKMTSTDMDANSMWVGARNSNLYWVGILDILGLSTIDEFKEFLANRYANGNPVRIIYKLATPIVTDITDLFTEDNAIEVEGGGELVPVNEHEMSVQTTIGYVTRKE